MNALNILCAQLMRDLLAIAKFLLRLPRNVEIEVENQWFNQTAVCCSDIPPACVRPPVPFSYFINVCSMTRSDLRPVQELLLQRITGKPFSNFLNTSGCLMSRWPISWT